MKLSARLHIVQIIYQYSVYFVVIFKMPFNSLLEVIYKQSQEMAITRSSLCAILQKAYFGLERTEAKCLV